MSEPDKYTPGPADRAWVKKEGDKWTLVVVRELAHPPAKVWEALTKPEHLSEWAPYDADRSLGAVGPVKLTTIGAPTTLVTETRVTRADAPKDTTKDTKSPDHKLVYSGKAMGTLVQVWFWTDDEAKAALGASAVFAEMKRLAGFMDEVAKSQDENVLARIAAEVKELCAAFPAPGLLV